MCDTYVLDKAASGTNPQDNSKVKESADTGIGSDWPPILLMNCGCCEVGTWQCSGGCPCCMAVICKDLIPGHYWWCGGPMWGLGRVKKTDGGFTMDNVHCGPLKGGCCGIIGSWDGKAAYVKKGGAPSIAEMGR